MATVLPGFRQFRYPAKLFTLTALAVAALAGLGWDRLVAGRGAGTAAVFLVLLVLTLLALAVVVLQREPILASFRGSNTLSLFGPLDVVAAYRAIIRSLGQAAIVFGLGLLADDRGPEDARPGGLDGPDPDDCGPGGGQFAICLDGPAIAVRNQARSACRRSRTPSVPTPRRRAIPHPPRAGLASAKLGRDHVAGPIPRGRSLGARHTESQVRDRYGLEYTYTIGVGELADYEPFFASFYLRVPDDQAAAALGVAVGETVVYFPRRAYDMWNTRYLIVPFDAGGWRDPTRASAPFLFQTSQVYPDPAGFDGPQGAERARNWTETRDFRVLRNLEEYPRAWVVHDAREATPVTEPSGGVGARPCRKCCTPRTRSGTTRRSPFTTRAAWPGSAP